ncbi:sulfide/dihydroorotate dehydrogenase-like FAD/NAD-binding protein [Clostridium perfringens]|uniref:sulfide/dihydroorotate dehydrogenase-like FAD/NAD-binding protein n=1 Tax=Clostridium perfringens TaxID=1502 RepID=UPI001F055D6D|nr:sulfide/dihydroorotate dehydrogenase-like FAD/NAD-binding protein [Clostridium perfringens]MDM0470970.1 sulfide/dihydroorotate dehydrogenase-like FAD/NAD-binding protein [Clostridium perfringens]MDM0476792.1 sulfide/dihydroorotate dehydrogenase-like FAD/NAD-binding protein [Clostridium perfringens]MDM0479898.1 sulfide/dihydroorotate dehydrogenase-like FAD/NAD-binding protein [Clostridium perfringens]MDM0485067.1 sulfide/dihydroorotate dehydrogenase-like FAD/NAD-binding protein [Clostridium p
MFKILEKRYLNDSIYLMKIEAPRVANKAKPGQFIILRTDEEGERIPLTIADYNKEDKSVTIVVQGLGASTLELGKYNEGDYIHDFLGPLGRESDFIYEDLEELKKERILFVAGGVGAAPVYPQVKWLYNHGILADVIVGARNKDLLIFEKELREVSKNLYIATDDGSYGFKGRVTELLEDLVRNKGINYNRAIVIGPMIMMKFMCILTKELNIPTTVSLNPIMVDGTGMCGACRVTVGGEVKFACVDGPEFNGHLVDFDESIRRQAIYKTEEGRAFLKLKEGNTHSHGGCGCRGDLKNE